MSGVDANLKTRQAADSMKFTKIIPIVILTCLFVAFGPIGCATTGGNSQQTVLKVSSILKTSANAAVVFAIQDDANNKRHVELAVTILDQFILDGSYEPGKLVAALEPSIKELKKPLVRLVVNGVLNSYQLLYADYVKGRIGGNENAKVLLTALRDGAKDGLPK